jgi:hypothetical protein
MSLTGKETKGSAKLESSKNISDYWLAPDPKHLHVVVEVPLGKRCERWVSETSLTLSRLTSTAANSIRYPRFSVTGTLGCHLLILSAWFPFHISSLNHCFVYPLYRIVNPRFTRLILVFAPPPANLVGVLALTYWHCRLRLAASPTYINLFSVVGLLVSALGSSSRHHYAEPAASV